MSAEYVENWFDYTDDRKGNVSTTLRPTVIKPPVLFNNKM